MYKCPICKSKDYTLKYDINSYLEKVPEGLIRSNKVNVKIIACSNCGLEANEKITTNFDFSKLYKKDLIYSKSKTYKASDEYPIYTRDILDLISSFCSDDFCLLEIGAFTGSLLSRLTELKIKCEGVELDQNAVAIAEKKKIQPPIYIQYGRLQEGLLLSGFLLP